MASKGLVVADDKKLPTALAEGFEGDAGAGYEDADQKSFSIPFLVILQSNSPQVKKSHGQYVEGAEEGMLFNTVTRALYEPPVKVVLCHHRVSAVEWILKKEGGGFVKEWAVSEAPATVRNDDNRDVIPERPSHEIIETYYYYVLLVTEAGEFEPALIGMKRTQVKKGKAWYSTLNGIKLPKKDGSGVYTPPTFAHLCELTTVAESKDDNTWQNWQAARLGYLEDGTIYQAAKGFHEAVRGGELREATETQDAAESVVESDGGGGAPADEDAEY